MARQGAFTVENSFINGLVTEASGLNFPDSAVTDVLNCEFNIDGSVNSRNAIDFEENFSSKIIDRSNKAITSYLWKNVSGNGDISVVVTQVGDTLYFYETDGTGNFSGGAKSTSITLTGVSGAPLVETVEAQFSDGNGLLFVTHPYCDPVYITYDTDAHTASATTIHIYVRDFEGALADPYAVDERPTATLAGLNVNHKYNLYNQGWTTTNLTAWDTAQTTMPSNSDVMWRFKDSSDNFDASTTSINRVTAGNTPALKGHFILKLSNTDRDTASGLTGVADTTTAFYRPSTSAFFAGRVFYAGVNYTGFNSNLYFTQIIERPSQYGSCYQANDPTSEDLFDLLPSDGGVISIPDVGTVYKLFTLPGGLCVFAANGIWFITGSTGLGFTANDYSVQKIANVGSISHTSFVNVAGFPCWWNSEGIYIMTAEGNLPNIQSLTYDKIKSFYDEIPLSSKRYARGFYHTTDGNIRWLYRSEGTNQINSIYEYDRMLNFNVHTKAFSPWSFNNTNVKIHSILSTELITRPVDVSYVVDSLGDYVVDSSGGRIISFSQSGSLEQQFDKYLVSYLDNGSYKFTFADRSNSNTKDWYSYDNNGESFESYFVSGYKLIGSGIRKFQNIFVNIFSRLDTDVSYYFQGIWDYASTGSGTGRWSVRQHVSHGSDSYSNSCKRLKVRGNGKVLQFKVSSVPGKRFDIIGWSCMQGINAQP